MKNAFVTAINFWIGASLLGFLLLVKHDPTGVQMDSMGSLATFVFALYFFHRGLAPYRFYSETVEKVKMNFRESE